MAARDLLERSEVPRDRAGDDAALARGRRRLHDAARPRSPHGTGHHYGPAPWVDDLARAEWNPFYYHRADVDGIGLDRTASGSNAVAQYAPPVAQKFANLDTVPDEYLLWFHRLPWDHRMRSGRTLWEELVAHYDRGVAEVAAMRADWATLEPFVDAERSRRRRGCSRFRRARRAGGATRASPISGRDRVCRCRAASPSPSTRSSTTKASVSPTPPAAESDRLRPTKRGARFAAAAGFVNNPRRTRDLDDIRALIAANRENLDMREVREYLRLFGKEPLLEDLVE